MPRTDFEIRRRARVDGVRCSSPRSGSCNVYMMRRAGVTDLTLPGDLIWTVPVTPLEEQLPPPTRAPPQPIPILKCAYRARASYRIRQQPLCLTCVVWMCAVARSLATTRQRRRCVNAEANMRPLIV